VSVVRYDGGGPAARGGSLADVLERVLDKGVVIAGDVVINVLDIELLTLKLRLLIASADTARQMGIDWWENDPFLNSRARGEQDGHELQRENGDLQRRIERLEHALQALPEGAGEPRDA
jgi:flagellar biosynthesis/type III secretory pathway protein FliH